MLACQDTLSLGNGDKTVAQMDVVSGQNQFGAAGAELPEPLVIKVVNGTGQPVANQLVNFRVIDGGGSVYAGASMSNVDGLAQERWTLGPTPGTPQKLEARAVDASTGQRMVLATFTATAADAAQLTATVTVTPATVTLSVGGTRQMTATAKNSSGAVLSGKTFTWSSSNPSVASVSSTGLVTANGGGTATITASCEGKSGSATISVDAGSAIDTLFYEGFESGTLANWEDGINGTQTVLTDGTLAYGGTHLLRFTVPANGEGSHLAHFFMPGYDSIFVRLHVRYAANWTSNTFIALLRGSRIDNQWSSFGVAGMCPSGTDWFATNVNTAGTGNPGATQFFSFWTGMPREADGFTCKGQSTGAGTTYYNQATMARDVWHRVEFWVKLNTPGQSSSVQRIWIDGQLRGEWTGLNFRTTTDLKLNSLTILAYPETTSAAARQIYYDEILVTTAPTFGPPGPPPPPTPAAVATVTLNPSSMTLNINSTQQLTATLRDSNGNILTGRTIVWATSSATVATVSTGGLVTGKATGNATITATSEGKSGTASVTVTQGGGFTPPDILSHNFDNGTLGPFTDPFQDGTVTVVADPTGKLAGSVARINYVISPGGVDHQDSNRFFQVNIGGQNRSQVFVRCDFVLGTPTGSDPMINRKMFYFKSPNYPAGNGWAVVLGLDDLGPNDRNRLSTSYGEVNFFPVSSAYNVAFNRRYTVEIQVKRNTNTGTSDGQVRVWITNDQGATSLVVDRQNLRIATKTTEPIELIEIGRQVDRFFASDDVREFRYWDRCAISSQRIGP